MANNYNDGVIAYGSRVVNMKRQTVSGNSGVNSAWGTAITNLTAAIMENIEVDRGMRDVEVFNEVGKPRGSFGNERFVTGRGTVQLKKEPGTFTADGVSITGTTLSTLQPGDGFATTFDFDLGSESFVILTVDQGEEMNQVKKVNITYKKLYNVTITP